MTGTYQVLDKDRQPDYGTNFSPSSQQGDTLENSNHGDSDPPRSGSPECVQTENGLSENEHVPEKIDIPLRSGSPECLQTENGLNEIEHVPEKNNTSSSMLFILIY